MISLAGVAFLALSCGIRCSAGDLLVETLGPDLVRVRRVGTDGSLLNRYGILADPKPTASETVSEGKIDLAAGTVCAESVGAGFRLRFPLTKEARVYGLGDCSRANIQRRPGTYDINVANVTGYIPIPMFISSDGYGVLVNTTFRNAFDVGGTDKDGVICTAERGDVDFYVFTGKDYRALLDVYTRLSGRPALLPVFGYGYTFVCNQFIDEFNLVREAREFRDRDLPCDVIGLEPGWMEDFYDFRTTKMWNQHRFYFPYWCPKSHHTFIAALGRMGFKLSLWLCCDYDLTRYEEECLGGLGGLGGSGGSGGLGGSGGSEEDGVFHDENIEKLKNIRDPRYKQRRYYPKKTVPEGREPWFEHLKFFVDQGVRCFKLDGCRQIEQNDLKRKWANGRTTPEMHNCYPVIYAKQMARGYEGHARKRAMVYSSGGYAGVQQYVATWAGDTGGGPKSLISCLNLAASGHSNQSCDMDIYKPNPEGKELPRVVNAEGLHFGFLQPWSQQANWDYWEQPWYQPDEGVAVVRRYLKLRYRLIPYLYGAAAEASRTGWPMMRPLAFMHPERRDLDNVSSTYYLGDSLLVSCYTDKTIVPAGRWYDWWTGEAVTGPCVRQRTSDPTVGGGLFVKAGAILPLLPEGVSHVEKGWAKKIELHVWDGADGSADWYEDDGDSLSYRKGEYALTPLTFVGGELTVGPRQGTFAKMPAAHELTVVLHRGAEKKTVALGEVSADRGRTVDLSK